MALRPNRLVARLAAGLATPGALVVVEPSQARSFLAALSIEHLPLSEESRERLELLGVRRFGQLLICRGPSWRGRFGPDALALVQAAEADDEQLAAYRPVEWLSAEVLVDGSLETRAQLAET